MQIISLKVYRASSFGLAEVDEVKPVADDTNDSYTNELFPDYVTSFREVQSLDEADQLFLEIHKGSPWHIQNVIDKGDRIVIGIDNDDDDVADEWRCYRLWHYGNLCF